MTTSPTTYTPNNQYLQLGTSNFTQGTNNSKEKAKVDLPLPQVIVDHQNTADPQDTVDPQGQARLEDFLRNLLNPFLLLSPVIK